MKRRARQCFRAVLIATVVFCVALPLHYVQASAPESVVINELAWAGTTANANLARNRRKVVPRALV